ncbi:MAG: NAD(P)-dependent oxidoreductase [Pyrinomonadaceae bacterium]|nr:NAD(P)-dependent oxidoreductase [Pyrinomonadaceae bacterium]
MIENLTGKKILVTGGTGFLGRYVVRELISKGLAPTVLTRETETEVFGEGGKKIDKIKMDLLDTGAVGKYLKQFRPEIIIHLAGATYQRDVLERLNFDATAHLLEAASALGVRKFMMLGTSDEYGFQECPHRETMAAMPVSDYAVTKNKAVNRALALYKSDGLPVVILRPATIYGIAQPSKMFIAQAVHSAVSGIPFEMSEGRQKRDALFVTDFVNAMIKTLTVEGIEGEIFNVGSGESVALRELAAKIWKIAGADEKLLKIGARPTNAGELHNTGADISKISEKLDWKPKVSLDEGLEIVVERAKKDWQ